MSGNVLTGETVIASPVANSLIRVMHMSFGAPFTSALHEPHFPALQFQRTARSGAWVAWIRWTTSRTTMPASIGTTYSTCSPAEPSPRRIFILTSGLGGAGEGAQGAGAPGRGAEREATAPSEVIPSPQSRRARR